MRPGPPQRPRVAVTPEFPKRIRNYFYGAIPYNAPTQHARHKKAHLYQPIWRNRDMDTPG